MKIEILDFPKIADRRGNLTFIQSFEHVPFKIERVFWTYDVPGGEIRGGHAYKTQIEVIIALSGSFDVVLTSKDRTLQRFHMNRSYYGLLIPPNNWRHLENFSTNSLSLHLSSMQYDANDYLRDFLEFSHS